MSLRVFILLRKNMSRLLGLGLFQDSHEKEICYLHGYSFFPNYSVLLIY